MLLFVLTFSIIYKIEKKEVNKMNINTKKILVFLFVIVMLFFNGIVTLNAYSENESTTNFNWEKYDHGRGSLSGSTFTFSGYTDRGYNDFWFTNETKISKKRYTFTLDERSVNYHSFTGGGFLFGMKDYGDSSFAGYALLIDQSYMKIVRINKVNKSTYSNDEGYSYTTIQSKAKSSSTIHSISLDTDGAKVKVTDNGSIVFDLTLSTYYGEAFGMVADHLDHSCSRTSTFILKDLVLNTEVEDVMPPTLIPTVSTTGWTSNAININLNMNDSMSGVSKVKLPDGSYVSNTTGNRGFSLNYAVSANGTYYFTVYDVAGFQTTVPVTINNFDNTNPTYSSYSIQNIDQNGYDVYVYGVGDDKSGINRIQFPTWTDYNGQDDIQPTWWSNSSATGTNLGGGTWKFRVNKSDHNNELGQYNTHVYIYDNAGNYTVLTVSTSSIVLKWNDDATITSNDIPATMDAGKSYTVHVTVKNTGNKTWDGYYRLGAVGESDPFATTRQWLPTGTTVAPGQSYTFTYTMTAPKTPGTYTTDWRMVHEGVTWFGSSISYNVNVVDYIKPKVSHQVSNTKWTNQPVKITITASDTESGVKSIKLPNNSIQNLETTTYTVSSNGIYNFEVMDKAGNVTVESVTISNIDLTAPTLNLSTNTNLFTNQQVTIQANAFDSESGVVSITLPNGQVVNGSNASYTVTANGTYTFSSVDSMGNTSNTSITITNIVVINTISGIDHIEYKLDGATVQDWTTYPGSLTVTNEGITTVTVRAIDKAGNYSDTASSIVRLDRSKPINGNIQIIIK